MSSKRQIWIKRATPYGIGAILTICFALSPIAESVNLLTYDLILSTLQKKRIKKDLIKVPVVVIGINEKDINQIKKNINLNLAKLNSLELTEENIESIQLSIKNVDMQLILLEDSVQALNSYKNQLNQVILEIQTDISIIQSSSIQNLPNQN